MDQVKIGKFIQEKRKEKNLTQSELAFKLGISDRAISKWENGKCMPDVGTIPELCMVLEVSINDLFSGQMVDMENEKKVLEENLLEAFKQKENSDKKLLSLEVILGISIAILWFGLIVVASLVKMEMWIRLVIIIPSTLIFITVCLSLTKVEQVAGYYECEKCHYKYIPTYKQVLFAPHMGRTRKMTCPKCQERSWQKKVISK